MLFFKFNQNMHALNRNPFIWNPLHEQLSGPVLAEKPTSIHLCTLASKCLPLFTPTRGGSQTMSIGPRALMIWGRCPQRLPRWGSQLVYHDSLTCPQFTKPSTTTPINYRHKCTRSCKWKRSTQACLGFCYYLRALRTTKSCYFQKEEAGEILCRKSTKWNHNNMKEICSCWGLIK